jgi:hypothetical protein
MVLKTNYHTMIRLLPILVICLLSGKANDSYQRTQFKIKTVQTKTEEVNQKIDDITLQIDSLGFLKPNIESL